MSTLLGTTSDGRALTYDAELYEFALDDERVEFADVQMLDTRNWVRWRADVLRDWFRHIDAADLQACNRRARSQKRGGADGERIGLGAESGFGVDGHSEGADTDARLVTIELDRGFVKSVLECASNAQGGSAEKLITLAIKVK